MTEFVVADADEVGPGERIVTELKGREIAVFNLDGEFHAYLNWCRHQGGPICEGNLTGTVEATYDRDSGETSLAWAREDEVLMCPWHGWEYDVTSGACLSKRTVELPCYPVEVQDGELVVTL
jgi:nitrite reductase/ring-hydroxylating ferredoxin subunit